ncbi:uncharacterized protein LOC142620781 [Castanea sativa]|uniref:uncharacterized protein LOC142620781 n=1 Tax=Castanea sativa TaxID=21020 RepID=UPI003F64928F
MNMKDIGEYFSTKFSEVFQSSSPSVPLDLDGLIEPCISAQENEMLTVVPSADDIRRVVFEMHPLKAPGLDGMPGLFYRHYWSIVGDQLVAAVQSFFKEGWLLRELNHTYPQSSRSHEAKINPFRGLRQGDPLSPYLFIIGCEVLARLISSEENKGSIRVVHLANGASTITKLFYADDVMLFCNVKLSEIRTMLNCLDRYGKWSGQIISVEKSSIFSSKGVHLDFLRQVKNQWGFKKLRHGTKYLRVPLYLSNNKARDFA